MRQRLQPGACANGLVLKRLLLAGRENGFRGGRGSTRAACVAGHTITDADRREPRRYATDNHLHVYDRSPTWERLPAGELQE